MLTAMAVPMSAAEPLKLMTAPETPKYLAYINSWKPELPVLTPVEAIEEYKTPQMVLDMISHAKEFMGLRYRRGGKTPKGFDCSGFTGYIFKQFGISLKASSSSQYTQGTPVVTSPRSKRPGVFQRTPCRHFKSRPCGNGGRCRRRGRNIQVHPFGHQFGHNDKRLIGALLLAPLHRRTPRNR